ncbi:hypothetical protein HPP92_011018 [Vanilla planifolia]|uniref:Uncharacterized protein n=1 Tax=Vanilla planifolia TaxID=51239 RepID=A0A835V1D9_VANPL|nr:hypothetical protein HPP92_011018 [Vanilla planifolia]
MRQKQRSKRQTALPEFYVRILMNYRYYTKRNCQGISIGGRGSSTGLPAGFDGGIGITGERIFGAGGGNCQTGTLGTAGVGRFGTLAGASGTVGAGGGNGLTGDMGRCGTPGFGAGAFGETGFGKTGTPYSGAGGTTTAGIGDNRNGAAFGFSHLGNFGSGGHAGNVRSGTCGSGGHAGNVRSGTCGSGGRAGSVRSGRCNRGGSAVVGRSGQEGSGGNSGRVGKLGLGGRIWMTGEPTSRRRRAACEGVAKWAPVRMIAMRRTETSEAICRWFLEC